MTRLSAMRMMLHPSYPMLRSVDASWRDAGIDIREVLCCSLYMGHQNVVHFLQLLTYTKAMHDGLGSSANLDTCLKMVVFEQWLIRRIGLRKSTQVSLEIWNDPYKGRDMPTPLSWHVVQFFERCSACVHDQFIQQEQNLLPLTFMPVGGRPRGGNPLHHVGELHQSDVHPTQFRRDRSDDIETNFRFFFGLFGLLLPRNVKRCGGGCESTYSGSPSRRRSRSYKTSKALRQNCQQTQNDQDSTDQNDPTTRIAPFAEFWIHSDAPLTVERASSYDRCGGVSA